MRRDSIGEKLVQAQNLLPKGYRLLIKECHRPMLVQKEFWDSYFSYLKSKFPTWSDQEIYDECSKLNAPLEVAPHTTGGAVDLTLSDESGNALDLGTKFNAGPLETENATFTIATNISDEARKNRQILMSVMSKAGFVNYPTEWWHWSYGDKYWAFQTRHPYAIYDSINSEINTLKSQETL
ncbi:MAG: M15 family metallopeptidase [Bdellovibrionaceae bacterium]|nr:M15 family metallopeptidase [Pseudobdellovibrionaceae bacterium]